MLLPRGTEAHDGTVLEKLWAIPMLVLVLASTIAVSLFGLGALIYVAVTAPYLDALMAVPMAAFLAWWLYAIIWEPIRETYLS